MKFILLKMNEHFFLCKNCSLFKCFKKGKNRKISYDIENAIKLKASEESNDKDEKIESKKNIIIEKIYFIILICIGIIIIFHIIHFFLSDYVRKLYYNNL